MNTNTTANRTKDTILTEWKEANQLLTAVKAREALLRTELVGAFSMEAKPGYSGTENVTVGWGYTLKIVHKINYNLDKSDSNAKVDAMLDALEKSQPFGSVIAERLVKWSPELSVSEYKKLDNAQKAIVDKVLTIKDATPSIELVPPKGA